MLYNYPFKVIVKNPPSLQLLPDPTDLPSAGREGSARTLRSSTHSPRHGHTTGYCSRTPSAAPRAVQPGKHGTAQWAQQQNSSGKAGSCNGITRRARTGSTQGFKHIVSPQSPPAPSTGQGQPQPFCWSLACPEKQTPLKQSRQPACMASQILGCIQTDFKVYFTAVWICLCL